ncbi:uncharacterized protein LOC119179225 isoform X1 [Rhipicephalus microplus]|uniref:uncharacterized protein LOC119179225 isoform X1 n=2 Tax=Rhipicephalus microplus TaxID=6941 RepID=UPI003F6C9D3E
MRALGILAVVSVVTTSCWAPTSAVTMFPTNATVASTENSTSLSNVDSTTTVASTTSMPSTTFAPEGSTATEATNASAETTTSPEETTPTVTPSSNNVSSPDTTTRLASDDVCIEATIPNVMNIGECLGEDLDLCSGEKIAGQAFMSLVRCTAKVTFENMSPINSLIALRDVFTTIIYRVSPRGAAILQNMNFKPDGSDLNNNICKKPIKLGFPNSMGKCLGEMYKLCNEGDMVDVSYATSFVAAVTCGFTEFATTTPIDKFRGVVCDILMGSKAVFGKIPFVGSGTYELAKIIFC